jgi:hypothetical protein
LIWRSKVFFSEEKKQKTFVMAPLLSAIPLHKPGKGRRVDVGRVDYAVAQFFTRRKTSSIAWNSCRRHRVSVWPAIRPA